MEFLVAESHATLIFQYLTSEDTREPQEPTAESEMRCEDYGCRVRRFGNTWFEIWEFPKIRGTLGSLYRAL